MLDFWISGFLTFLCLLSASCESGSKCTETSTDMMIKKVTSNTTSVSIKCPDLQKDENKNFTISLHRKSGIHSTHMETEILNTSDEKERFRVNITNMSVHYIIHMPQVNDSGLYKCRLKHRTTETLLLVKEPLLCLNEGKTLTWMLLITGCALFTLYNCICTIFTWYFGWKLKCGETHESEYYNTRPGEFQRAR